MLILNLQKKSMHFKVTSLDITWRKQLDNFFSVIIKEKFKKTKITTHLNKNSQVFV